MGTRVPKITHHESNTEIPFHLCLSVFFPRFSLGQDTQAVNVKSKQARAIPFIRQKGTAHRLGCLVTHLAGQPLLSLSLMLHARLRFPSA